MSVHGFMVRLSSSMTRLNRLKKWMENSNRSEKELEDAEPSREQRGLLSAVARASPEFGEETSRPRRGPTPAAHALEKKSRPLHDAAAQHDGIRGIKVDQIGEAQAQVVGLMLDGLERNFISLLSQFADTLRGDAFAMRITRRHVPG